jgi:peptide/nickel transport system permease protein
LILAVLIVFAVLAPVIAPYHPVRGNLAERTKPPLPFEGSTTAHILGTDQQGRDIFTRLMYGARVSLTFAAATMALGLTFGAILGAISGYFGGHIDEFIMRLVDLSNALPFILVALVVVMVFGPSFMTLLVILSIFSWDSFARQVRGEVLQLTRMDYVSLARVAGASPARIIWKHLLPGVTNTLIVVCTLRTGQIILAESTLSFLGVGIPPPNPAWGSMVSDGRQYLSSAWWIAVIPGLGIGLTVFALNFLGDWLRDHFDPRLRQT